MEVIRKGRGSYLRLAWITGIPYQACMLRRLCLLRFPWMLLAAGFALAANAGIKDGKLDLYWVDSEGGGSTLIITPLGESVLIDSGNPGGRDSGRIHKLATEVAELKEINHLIVTHFHIDHFGGAAELASHLPIRNVWDNGLTDADPDGRRESTWPLTSKAYREMPTDARHQVRPGVTVPLRAGPGTTALELRCYIARQEPWTASGVVRPPISDADAAAVPAKARDGSDNANSSAWVLSFGNFRFYDGGDLTWNTEATLVMPKVLVPEVDILQVTHHGLDVSNHPLLMRALNPTVSVMNNGPTKGTMGQVIQSLRSLPGLKDQYQLHKNVRPDGATNNCPDAFIANVDRDCEGHWIHCAVAADGSSYTISIPGTGKSQTYSTRVKAAGAAAGLKP